MGTAKFVFHSAPDRIAVDEQRTAQALRASESTNGDADPARGIATGILLGLVLWALILAALWAVFF